MSGISDGSAGCCENNPGLSRRSNLNKANLFDSVRASYVPVAFPRKMWYFILRLFH